MKNKWIKKCLVLLSSGCLALAVAGCSQVDTVKEQVQGVADQVLGKDVQENQEEEQEEETAQEPQVEVAKPELTTNLSGSVTYKVGDTAKALKVEVAASDGGVITYQWYQSSTNKNGGGTPVEGATENTYVPSTKEAGTMYYYAVATSTIGNSSNGITSATAEVIVTEEDSQKTEGQEQAAETQSEEQKEENTQETPQEDTQENAQDNGQEEQD